ncbi:anti-sigma factor [Streptomyces sp. PU-14G]|uniref:anti-sigma factor family protein n=1 Tax=Streptomyces sp. PU-14G TaxID=2800808 RepID=UPI0034E0409E
MTSTPFPYDGRPVGEHPDVAEISALSEGVLPVEREPDLRTHLEACDLCAEVRDSLEEIRTSLGTLPGPVRMPEDVAARIDAAMSAEARTTAEADGTQADGAEAGASGTDASESGAAEDGASESGVPDDGVPEDGAVSRETAPDVAAPLPRTAKTPVSRETTSVRRSGDGRPPGHASGAGGPGREVGAAGNRRARRRRRAVLVAAASVAVLALGGVTLQALSDSAGTKTSSGTAKSGPEGPVPAVTPSPTGSLTSDTDSDGSGDDHQLRKRVQRLLSDQPTSSPTESAPSSSKPSASPSLDTKQSPSTGDNTLRDDLGGGGTTVPSCVRDALGRTETPLAVDPEATFANRSGYLVVLPHQGGDTEQVDAYLVDPYCISADPPQTGEVLFQGTYPRG